MTDQTFLCISNLQTWETVWWIKSSVINNKKLIWDLGFGFAKFYCRKWILCATLQGWKSCQLSMDPICSSFLDLMINQDARGISSPLIPIIKWPASCRMFLDLYFGSGSDVFYKFKFLYLSHILLSASHDCWWWWKICSMSAQVQKLQPTTPSINQ